MIVPYVIAKLHSIIVHTGLRLKHKVDRVILAHTLAADAIGLISTIEGTYNIHRLIMPSHLPVLLAGCYTQIFSLYFHK